MSTSWQYQSADSQRFIVENPKSPARTDFERDRARVVHSSALRRLGEKTQVLGPASDDFIRTRLTHSLEVAQVGRELGKELGADPDVVDAACLSHDLGHPPFGHNGEGILNELAADAGGFEGNAQTFRIVTRLEPKVVAQHGQPAGLNLTRATLDAIVKYPWLKGLGPDLNKSQRKYSVYREDQSVFAWVRRDAPVGQRCLEAQIMDLSDDIAYSVHDVEDAVATGKLDVARLKDHQDGIIASTVSWYGRQVSADQLGEAFDHLLNLPAWMTSFSGNYADLAALKNLTSQLIGHFCQGAVRATREAYGDQPLGRFAGQLIVPPTTRAQIQVLKGMAVHYVMSPRESEPVYYQQRTLISDLFDALWHRPDQLEEPFLTYWRDGDEPARIRAVCDQIATLTDISASRWHARLCGMLSTQL